MLASVFEAGNRPLPLLLLELAAVGFLFAIVAVHRARKPAEVTPVLALRDSPPQARNPGLFGGFRGQLGMPR